MTRNQVEGKTLYGVKREERRELEPEGPGESDRKGQHAEDNQRSADRSRRFVKEIREFRNYTYETLTLRGGLI